MSLVCAAPAQAQHDIGNGGGYSEGQVLFALSALKESIVLCAEAPAFRCPRDADQERAMALMTAALDGLGGRTDYVRFAAEADAPDLFPPGRRVAFVTEPQPGAPVTINRTLLYRSTGTGFYAPVSLRDAYGLVTQVVARQATDLAQDRAFELGVAIGALLQTRSTTLELGLSTDPVRIADPEKRLRFLALGTKGPEGGMTLATVLLQDSEQMRDLTVQLVAALSCDDGGTASGLSLARVRRDTMSLSLSRLQVRIRGEVRHVCSNDPSLIRAATFTLDLAFAELVVPAPRGTDDRAFRFLPQSLRFTVEEAQ